MAPRSPTHEVTHRNGWKVHLYIADSLQQKLNSRDRSVRDGARQSVCIAFREACRKKFSSFGIQFVEWTDLTLRDLVPSPPQSPSYRPTVVSTAVQYRDSDERECDECPMCEIGDHEYCNHADGCPNATAWLR